ncbi:MAG: hypothetical protein CVT48_05985 [Thermoplasmata archaeon HGW-Thermoplasmata-1]|nr:MAG: hypothetical protein CVT48_05985 [Thermoplasmata archaeon HGW-Thermoplasmata-1]
MKNIWIAGIIGMFLVASFAGCIGGDGGDDGVDIGAKPSGQEDGNGWIFGTVSSAAGAVAGATVTVEGTQFAVSTDSNGQYTIVNVEPGSYVVDVVKGGFAKGSMSVVVESGKGTEASFTLVNDETPGLSKTITLYFTAEGGLTTVAPTASEYQTVDTSPVTTPAVSSWIAFTGFMMPEGAKIKKFDVKYWYTADAVNVVTEADSILWVNGGKVDSTRVSQAREDVITAGTVIGVEFSGSGVAVEKGDDVGAGVLIFASTPGGNPAGVKIVVGSSAYPSSVTFTASEAVFPII